MAWSIDCYLGVLVLIDLQGRVVGHLTIVLLREQNHLVEIVEPASSYAIRRAPCEVPRELLS